MTDRAWKTEPDLYAPHAEKALMGALGFYPDALAGTLAELDPADFYRPARGAVWAAAREMSANREPVEATRLIRELVRRDEWNSVAETVVKTEMATAAPASHAAEHAATVADLAQRRRILRAIHRAHVLVEEHPGDASEVLAAIRVAITEAAPAEQPDQTGGPLHWPALVAEFEHEHDHAHGRAGIRTPWREFDNATGGLHPGRVYVFGGRPGSGKSTAAIGVAVHAAMLGHPTLIISKEMPSVDVTGRIVAAGAEVDLHAINNRRLDSYDRAKARDFFKSVGPLPLTVDARPRRLSQMRTIIRTHHQRHGLDVLVVDYLQLVRTDTPSRSREQEVAEVSRALKETAMELGCAVVLPAQLNRESVKRADGLPTMADLRDSGQIEQDADVVTLLYRHPELLPDGTKNERYGEIDLIVDKNRHGPTAKVTALWQGGYGSIGDMRSVS